MTNNSLITLSISSTQSYVSPARHNRHFSSIQLRNCSFLKHCDVLRLPYFAIRTNCFSSDHCCQTTLRHFQNSTAEVKRRYSDFVALHAQLVRSTNFAGAQNAIPSVPSDTWASMIWRSSTFGAHKAAISSFFPKTSLTATLIAFVGRFEEEFIDDRSKALAGFLDILIHHPVTMDNDNLRQFLESATWSPNS